ncbi:MAG TPA: hypothetical protein VIU34_17065 [Steroidobacter sp.]
MKMADDSNGTHPLDSIASWGPVVLVVLGAWGRFSVPSCHLREWLRVATWAAVAVGLFYAIFSWGVPGFGWSAKNDARLERRWGRFLRIRLFRVPLATLMFFACAQMGFGAGMLWLLNLAIGHYGEMTATIDGWDSEDRRGCSQPTLQHVPPLMRGAHALCLEDRQQRNLPPGTAVRISGQVSVLGVDAERVEW